MLLNLGTPDSTSTTDVRRYLREFLSDPRVLDIHPVLRTFLLEAVILPRRPAKSAEAYRSIWTERGSPLLFHAVDLADKVRARLGPEVQVEVAMRYQNPSIAAAMEAFRVRGVDSIAVFPLFPQYSSAAFGSGVQQVYDDASRAWNVTPVQVVPAYYDHPAFIAAFARVTEPVLAELQPDRVMFSFHGVPVRHVQKSDESPPGSTHCRADDACCASIVHANRHCYRAQCFATARALTRALDLRADTTEVAFQSRLGRDPWIEPYTDVRIVELAKSGTKRVAVVCPSFVADCLETIEEIGMRAREDFRSEGGEELRLVPSLNSEDAWADAVVAITRETVAGI
ncbi:MAG: ferrochelatase [Acidobacteria bacterium]|nr:ferrochelatase [Acidobacteriota bacterium]